MRREAVTATPDSWPVVPTVSARHLHASRLELLLGLRCVVGAGGSGLGVRDAIAEIHGREIPRDSHGIKCEV
jgi:hypothetical protein